ncbi:hypothetical protein TrST_g9417 [Triparma strigata]|uniref:Ion transport domain-containing protein n=1 Tax=Triparma strigata TaxID=1606541 RepID=A0A9W7ELV9_9STRA|nr:hypothetical protein TrST_g9417 [Triparma strigata]
MVKVDIGTGVLGQLPGTSPELGLVVSPSLAWPLANSYQQVLMESEDRKKSFRTLAVCENYVLAGCQDGYLYRRDMTRVTSVASKLGDHCLPGCLPGWFGAPTALACHGDTVCFGTAFGKIFLLDVETGKIIRDFEGHGKKLISGIAISRDGKFLVTSSYSEGSVVMWNLTPNEPQRVIKSFHGEQKEDGIHHVAGCLAFSPDDLYLCLGGSFGCLEVYSVSTLEILASLKVSAGLITAISFSKDGRKLYCGSRDGPIRMFDTSSDDTTEWALETTLTGHMAAIRGLSESPCGRYLASGSEDKTIRLWDTQFGFPMRRIEGHSKGVHAVRYIEGSKIISVSYDGTVVLWDLAYKGSLPVKVTGHVGKVMYVYLAHTAGLLVSCGDSADKSVRVWNYNTWELKVTLEGHAKCVNAAIMSKDGTRVVSCSLDETIIVWDVDKGEEIYRIALEKKTPFALAWAPDEKMFYAGGRTGALKQYSLETGEETKDFIGLTNFVFALAVTSDGKKIVSGSFDNNVVVWDVESCRKLKILRGHSKDVKSVAITPDDKSIVSGSGDGNVIVWDMEDGELLQTFRNFKTVTSVAIHPSGEMIATGSTDKKLKLWSLKSNSLLCTFHGAHTSAVQNCIFSSDGNHLISASSDKTVNVEDISPRFHLTSSLFHKMFLEECKVEDKQGDLFDWSQSETVTALLEVPTGLVEPDYILLTNLVHLAVDQDRSRFLEAVLIVGDYEAKYLMDDMGPISRQKLAFFALMDEDNKGKTPLELALQRRDPSVLGVIFKCLKLLFSQSYSFPFSRDHTSHEVHPQELLHVNVLCDAITKAPEQALEFVSQLKLITSGDVKVLEGVKRFVFKKSSNDRFIVGSRKRVPHGHWKGAIKDLEEGEQDGTTGDPVTAKFCPLKGVASHDSKFLKALVQAATSTKKYGVFENEVVMSIIEYKWETSVKDMFRRFMLLDIVMVLTMTVDALSQRSIHKQEGVIKLLGNVPMLITVVLSLWFAKHLHRQITMRTMSLRNHLKDPWVILDVASLSSIYIVYACRAFEAFSSAPPISSRLAMSIALPLAFLNTLYYMQGFDRNSGELVRMILGIIGGTGNFLIILSTCMVGFSASFFITFEGQTFENESMSLSFPLSLLKSYSLIFSGFELDDVNGSLNRLVASLLFVFFAYFINIVMLNLLIAIMGDIFDKIQENAKAEFMMARAQVILEFEVGLRGQEHKSTGDEVRFPTWLQVLVPTIESNELSDWAGKVRALKLAVTRLERKLEDSEVARKEDAKENKMKIQEDIRERREAEKDLKRRLSEAERRREEAEKGTKELLTRIAEKLAA